MAGEQLEVADLGWHGLDGDRRLAFRRLDDRSGFPWLTAGKLPEMILFAPQRHEGVAPEDLPTHVRTPDGEELPVFGEDLAAEVGRRHAAPVQMTQLKHGIFDDACISVIASETVCEIARLAGQSPDVRRFRPNILVRLLRSLPFQEDAWLGSVLSFGEGDDAPAIAVTMRDVRCSMINLDPDSAKPAPEVLKAAVRANQNNAGIYGTVTRIGRLAVGQTIFSMRRAKQSRNALFDCRSPSCQALCFPFCDGTHVVFRRLLSFIFPLRDTSPDESEQQQNRGGEPRSETENRWHVQADGYTAADEQRREHAELRHAVREDERQIVRAESDHEGGVEPVQTVKGGSSYEREIQRKSEGNLHSQGVHRVALGQGGGPAHQPQEQLRQREYEEASYDQRDDRGPRRTPRRQYGRQQPN
jgi:uncharacterized protein